MVNYNIRFTKMKLSHYWNLLGLLVSLTHLANGQVVFDLQGTSCESQDITLGCTISSFTTDATWKRGNGSVLAVTCSSTGPCSQLGQTIDGTTYSFQGNTSGIYMWTKLPLSEDGVNWTCSYSSTDYIYKFELGCSNNPCKGAEKTTKILCNTHGTPVGVEVIIVIIIIIIDTQRVKIIVTAEKEAKKLKSARQKINMGKEKTVPFKDVKGNNQHRSIFQECSIDVRGGDVHECVFETDAGVLRLNFMITDDLLNVQPGSQITLPTMLLVEPDYSSKQWLHDGNPIETNELLLHTIVTKSTYGIYDLEITFDNLGLKILIKNMRVQARNWIVMMICVVVNVPLVLIGGGVTEHYRSTDGFCVDVIVTIIAFVLPIIVYFILVMVFIYLFFLKKTGNEKNSGTENDQPNIVMINLKGKTSNESSVVEDKGSFKEISGRNNLLTPLQKETNSAQN